MTGEPMVVRQGDVSVVHLTGEIDLATAEPVERSVTAHAGDTPAMVVDLSDVTFIDSAGVRMLDHVVDACARGDVRLQIVAPPDTAVRFTLSICAFPEDLLSDSVAKAIARVGP